MSHPQKTAGREIRAHYTKTQRRTLGKMWAIFLRLPRKKPLSLHQRRAAIGRCARLRLPTPQEIAAALIPE